MKITAEDIQKYIELGGDLSFFKASEIAAISQEFINQYAANGGNLEFLSRKQIEAIPQEAINKRALNFGRLEFLTEEQKESIPKNIRQAVFNRFSDSVDRSLDDMENLEQLGKEMEEMAALDVDNRYVFNHESLESFDEGQLDNVPQRVVNYNVANGGDFDDLLCDDRYFPLPQRVVNQYVANGGYLGDDPWWFDEEQVEAIPDQILKVSKKAREALVLYAAGKISSSELPADVYANYEARKSLLKIIEIKTTGAFLDLCKDAGYDRDDVPEEVKEAFDERSENIEKEIEDKMISAVQYFTAEKAKKQEKEKGIQALEKTKIQSLKDGIMKMEW